MSKSVAAKIAEIVERERPSYSVTRGKVVSVDESEKTCHVSFADERVSNEKVKLAAAPDATMIIYPAVDSIVLVGFIDNQLSTAFISKVSKISKITIETSPGNSLTISVSDDGAIISCGSGAVRVKNDGTILGSESSSEPMVKGQALSTWASAVDAALTALIAWGASGVAPGPQGGISPLADVTASSFDGGSILSTENKVS